ncbi:unnamed protein product [Durusdinium trenchii]|uniref:Ion transport domain-containing protein n=1 Tax=Durusdinium trenchii TaxID=1381693 RepID=A0ABP0IF26_9DINO
MRTSIVSFGPPSVSSSMGLGEVETEGLHSKLHELHQLIERRFRQHAKLLRMEIRRSQRKSATLPILEMDDVSEKADEERSEESEVEGDEKGDEMDHSGETGILRSPDRTPPPSPPVPLLEPLPPSPGTPSRDSHVSQSSARAGKTRFGLRLSSSSAISGISGKSMKSNRSRSGISGASDQTAQSSRTDQSSPDSFILGAWNEKHLAQAKIAGMWMARRRATSYTEIEESCLSSYCREFIDSSIFTYVITLMIFLHVILMGIEADLYKEHNGAEGIPSWIGISNLVLTSFFLCELLLKFIALGCREFWCGRDWAWNGFDAAVISLSVVDVVLALWFTTAAGTGQVRVFRMIRILRYLRSIRVVRLFRYISALQVLTLSIIGTMSSLAWTLLLLILIIYSYSVVLTELVVEVCVENSECPQVFTSVADRRLVGFTVISL